MNTNLINNYIKVQNGSQVQPKTESPKKPMPEFSIKNELDNKTFIKPLPGKGRLIKGNIFYAPVNMIKTFAYDIKSLKHALKGDANDHELGKLNDVGMKFGGLAIAAYLFSQKQTPKTKAMEYVGLGSFFASMVLWKKIGIQLPAQLVHGVNVDKQYEDSFGRKKPFYLDPQFLPWDLYKDEEINKIGDRLGVPRDIPNRREFIQEKMKKIAVQNNTLWMLTAGLATPVMSALICNGLEKPLEKYLDKYYNAKADKLLENAESKYNNFRDNSALKKVNTVLEMYSDKTIDNKIFNEISSALTEDMDLVTAKAVKNDLRPKIFGDNYMINQKSVRKMIANMQETLKNADFNQEDINAIVPKEERLTKLLNKYGYMDKEVNSSDFSDILLKISKLIHKDTDKNILENNREFINSLLIQPKNESNPVVQGLQTVRSAKLNGTAKAVIKDLANIFTDFNAKIALLDRYAYLKTGAAPETVAANYYNNFVNDIMKLLKFTPSEVNSARLDRELMHELMQAKVEKICANTQEYNHFVQEYVKHMEHLQTVIKPSDISGRYDKLVNNAFTDVTAKLSDKNRNMQKTIEALIGTEVWENGQKIRKPDGSLLNIQLSYVHERINSIKNTFNRFLCMMDYNRRIATLTNVQALHPGMRREVKEEIVAIMKLMTAQGHASDFATKFYLKRNPVTILPESTADELKEAYSQIEVENGLVKYKYLGKEIGDKVDIPHDAEFFDEAMKLAYENPLHSDTENILKKHGLLEEINNYRGKMINYIGQDSYFVKPMHTVWGKTYKSSANKRYILLGAVPDEMLFKANKQIYNSKKWLKMFGGFGIGLLSATVIAQFFFGKMKTPQKIQQQKGN